MDNTKPVDEKLQEDAGSDDTGSNHDPKLLARIANQAANEYDVGLRHVHPWRELNARS